MIEYSGKQIVKTLSDIFSNLDCDSYTSSVNTRDESTAKDTPLKFERFFKDEKERQVSSSKYKIQKKSCNIDGISQANIPINNDIINHNVRNLKSNLKVNLKDRQGNLATNENTKTTIQIHQKAQQQSIFINRMLHTIVYDELSASDKLMKKAEFGYEAMVKDNSEVATRTSSEKNLPIGYQNLKMRNPSQQMEKSTSGSQDYHSEQIESDKGKKSCVVTAQGSSIKSVLSASNQSNILLAEFAEKLRTNVVVENTASSANVLKASKEVSKSEAVIDKEDSSELSQDKQYSKSGNIRKSNKSIQQDSETKPDLSDDNKQSPSEKNNSSFVHSDRIIVRNSTEIKPLPSGLQARNASMTDLPVDQTKLVNNVKLTLTSGRSELTIQLKPEVLGNALITLRQSENGLEMNFQVESDHAKNLIEAEAPQIREALAASGIQTSNIEVRTSDSNPERFATADNSSNDQYKQEQHSKEDALMEQESVNLKQFRNLGYNTFEIAA